MIQHAPLQKLTDAVNANMQTYLSFAEIVLNTSERLSSLNIDATRSSFKQFSAYATPRPGEGFTQQITARLGEQGHNLEQTLAYLRNVSEVYVQAQNDIADLGSRRLAELSEEFQALIDKAAKSAPVGSSEMVAAMKTALSQASSVYDSLLKTSREVTETHLAAATSALQPIAGTTGRASKKAA